MVLPYGEKKHENIHMYDLCMIALGNKAVAHSFLPSLSKKIVEIQKVCYHGNVTSHFSLVNVTLKYIKVKLLLCQLTLKRGFKFSVVKPKTTFYLFLKNLKLKEKTFKKYKLNTNSQKHENLQVVRIWLHNYEIIFKVLCQIE